MEKMKMNEENQESIGGIIHIPESIFPENANFIKYTNLTDEKDEDGVSIIGRVNCEGCMYEYVDREKLKCILLSQCKEFFGENINFDIDKFVDNVIKEYFKEYTEEYTDDNK